MLSFITCYSSTRLALIIQHRKVSMSMSKSGMVRVSIPDRLAKGLYTVSIKNSFHNFSKIVCKAGMYHY